MKKLSALLLVMLLLLLPVLPASASDVNKTEIPDKKIWTMGDDCSYVTDGKYTYYPIDFEWDIVFNWNDNFSINTTMTDVTGGTVSTDGKNILVRVEYDRDHSWYQKYFVEQSHLDEFNRLKDGEADTYSAVNDYKMTATITQTEYILALGGEQHHMTARRLESFQSFPFCAVDSSGNYRYEVGRIYRDRINNSDMFLLLYKEYDRSYFYRGGEFATDHDGEVTLYKIEDKALVGRLNTNFDTLPEDDLDWIVNTEEDNTFVGVFATVFFAIIPLGVALVALILLLKVKDKKYRLPFILILAGAVAVIIAYAVIFALISAN